jgi:TolB-like protein/Flp pilus assembly protein TadD
MSKVGSLYREARRRGVLQTAAVYVVGAWIILQAADVLFPGAGIPESAIRFVFLGAVLGFPLIMVFGWMYDIGAGGVKRTPSAQQLEQGIDPSLGRFDHVLLSGLGVLAVSVVLSVSTVVISQIDTVVEVAEARPVAENSIAVLPFVNMSDDPGGEYLGDGIAEELLNELANLRTLHVAARTSSFYFKGKNEPIPSIARQLGVRTILEGSVRRSGDRLRITSQLIDAANGYHIWSKTFDREVGDIFEIQEEIAESITGALKVKVLGKEKGQLAAVNTESFDAYDYYLLGQFHREKRNPESLDKSIELFNQALQADDQFALGYAALAASYLYQAYHSDLSPERVVKLTNPLLEKSLELNPRLAKAHAARASVRLLVSDFEAADAGYRKALELKPNYAGAWSSLGFSLVRQSRLKEAADAYARSESLDPLNANGQYNIGALKMLTGRYEEGLAAFEKVVALAPERVGTESAIVHWSIVYGHYEEAARWVVRLLEQQPDSVRTAASVATIYGNLGIWDKAWESISLAHEKAPDNIWYFDKVADFHFRTGDYARFYKFVADEFEKVDQLAPTRYSPTNRERYFWHGVAAITEGNYVQAIDDFTNSAGGPAGIENLVYDGITQIKYIAYALQQQGRDDEADELLNQCLALAIDALDQGWATPTIHYRTAQLYSLLGQPDEAIAQLQQAVDKGWKIAGDLEIDPLWYRLQDDVRFQTIVAGVNDEVRAQSERITELLTDS